MEINISDVVNLYYNKENSLREIAEKYSTYPNKIKRLLIKNGYSLRDYSDAQKLALNSGKVEHPTKGKPMSEESKIKLSKLSLARWNNMSQAKKDKHSQKMKEKWDNMSAQQKQEFRKKSAEAIRAAANEGSELEKYLFEHLKKAGLDVIFHWTELYENEKLEVDIFLPQQGIAVEIDGPSHFLPIWGQDRLEKTQKADLVKNGLLVRRGFRIIRVKCLLKNVALAKKHEASLVIEDLIKKNNIDKITEIEIK